MTKEKNNKKNTLKLDILFRKNVFKTVSLQKRNYNSKAKKIKKV